MHRVTSKTSGVRTVEEAELGASQVKLSRERRGADFGYSRLAAKGAKYIAKYLLWGLKCMNRTYFIQFGAPG